jgi:hypothetical protein
MCSTVLADEYQSVIAKNFPGFQILSGSEFDPEIQQTVKNNPGLIRGFFNDDELMDFAALVRDDVKRKGRSGKDYYRGRLVVCHALDKQDYKCQILGQGSFFVPFGSYLYRVGPKYSCDDDGKPRIRAKRDAIGSKPVRSNAASVYIYRPDGTYFNCAGD